MILYLCNKKKYDVKECFKDYCQEKGLKLTDSQIEKLEIDRNKFGKPFFKDFEQNTGNCQVEFSISHSGQYWACAMGKNEVGLDIEDLELRVRGRFGADKVQDKGEIAERNRIRYEALSKRFFLPAEHEFVKAKGPLGFTKIWIRKEAYVKYQGLGLAQNLDKFNTLNDWGNFKTHIEGVKIQEIDFLNMKSVHMEDWDSQNLLGVYCVNEDEVIENIKIV